MNPTAQHTRTVQEAATKFGFDFCGIAKAGRLDDDARRLEKWLRQGLHAGMRYMENHFDLRVDPTRLVPGARSVITLLKNYYPEERQAPGTPRISKYAWGKDYHDVIRTKLNLFLGYLRDAVGEIDGRGFVDSAPVLERSWAQRSGLGWVGKNGNLINRSAGSFFFIATLITDLDLEYDDPVARDYCGTCRRCIDACPTEAIGPDKVVDGSRCISYFTIELKEHLIPDHLQGQFEDWAFGCDTCQDVCPWNRFSRPHSEQAFRALPQVLNLTTREWEELSEQQYHNWFRDSPLRRAGYQGLQRNLRFLRGD